MSLFLRLAFLVAGLVFAASLAVVLVVLLALWGLRAAWAGLTGRPVAPFVLRVHPFGAFGDLMRRAPPPARRPRTGGRGPAGGAADVSDVEPRPPSS